MAAMLGDHCGHTQDTHYQEDGEEDNRNDKNRHTAPLPALCFGAERASVMAITA
jgi:hypothetical protein